MPREARQVLLLDLEVQCGYLVFGFRLLVFCTERSIEGEWAAGFYNFVLIIGLTSCTKVLCQVTRYCVSIHGTLL